MTEQENHFNKLTAAELENLALLSEECGEVIQAIGKIVRHGYESKHPETGETNREALERECGHVRHSTIRLCESGNLSKNAIHHHADNKAINVIQYLHHNN